MTHPENGSAEEPVSVFERERTREVLRSERLGIALVFGALLLASLRLSLQWAFVPEEISASGGAAFNTIRALLAMVLVWEGGVWLYLGHLLRTGGRPHPLLRYVTAFLEVSLPSAGILIAGTTFDPVVALTLPAVLAYFVLIALSALRLDAGLCLFSGAVAATEYGVLAWYAFASGESTVDYPGLTFPSVHVAKSVFLLVAGAITALVTHRIREGIVRSLQSVEERDRIYRLFGQHVSHQVVEKLVTARSALASEIRHVCVMFVDVQGFTAFAEAHDPDEVIAHLNGLFGFMCDSVDRHHGIVNKFLGDGFMAVFGAPISDGRDCVNAVEAALEISDGLEKAVTSGVVAPTRIRIGLHAGEAVTGNVGSTDRKEYTLIGDVVNVASRIERLNVDFDTQVLASDAVWQAVAGTFSGATPLGRRRLAGRSETVELHQLRPMRR